MKQRERKPFLNQEAYQALYAQSITDPTQFWDTAASTHLSWFSPWDQVTSGDFEHANVKWFINGQLNACYNCVDRHLDTRGSQTAILWEGNEPHERKAITYLELHEDVCKFATVLKSLGIRKGDRISIYLPMIPEIIVAMLACARIGAIHSVVFGGFSPEALKQRLLDADCCMLITADEGLRGEKKIPFKENSDKALRDCPNVKHVIVVQRTSQNISFNKARDVWYHEAMVEAAQDSEAEPMEANDPLFILYTSGSTGQPKGILHGTGGYLLYAAMTHRYIFDYQDNDIYWCTADVGWITGHTYLVYGPLANGATTLLFEGVPHYPSFSRYWEIVDKYKVNLFYTSPTAIRSLRKEGKKWITCTDRRSLKLLGTVGEPINPDVWEWYFDVVGEKRCPIVNTWWQTETGGILLSPFPGATPPIPGSVGWPFFGIVPELLDEQGMPSSTETPQQLFIKKPWPGLLQTIYGNRERFIDTYFKKCSGYFYTGDEGITDKNGQYFITGRNDDVIKVSGHRLSTSEVENALLTHEMVSEAAVVGVPDSIKGEHIYVFVTLKTDVMATEDLKKELVQRVREIIGPLATPEHIQWAAALPKTRSGKIMRRILRKIAVKAFDELGDLSTLADATVVENLIKENQQG